VLQTGTNTLPCTPKIQPYSIFYNYLLSLFLYKDIMSLYPPLYILVKSIPHYCLKIYIFGFFSHNLHTFFQPFQMTYTIQVIYDKKQRRNAPCHLIICNCNFNCRIARYNTKNPYYTDSANAYCRD